MCENVNNEGIIRRIKYLLGVSGKTGRRIEGA
jgi:hypothetical protein